MNYKKENGKNYVCPSIQITEVMGEEMMDITSPGGTINPGEDEAKTRFDYDDSENEIGNLWN